jgi:hypothetical protein
VRTSSALVVKACEWAGIEERLNRFSSWYNAQRAIAVCLRFKRILLARVQDRISPGRDTRNARGTISKPISSNPLNVGELNEARQEIVRIVQRNWFVEEVRLLCVGNNPAATEGGQGSQRFPKSSHLYRLDPIFTNDGLLRVGGRIRRAKMPLDVKHPCILPKKGHVTELIICHFHQKVAHQGRGMTHNSIGLLDFGLSVESQLSLIIFPNA